MASFYSDDETESFAGSNGQMMFNPSVYRKNRASQACVCISDCSGCDGIRCPGCYPVFKNTQDDHIGKYGCLGPDYDADGPFFEEPNEDELESDSVFEKYNDELYARYCGYASQDETDVLIEHIPLPIRRASACEKQLDSKQDLVRVTEDCVDMITNELFTCLEVYDGHGNNSCIKELRKMDTTNIIQLFPGFEFEIQKRLLSKPMHNNSGATCSVAKIYKNRVECSSIGDSKIAVFINGEIVFESHGHTWDNPDERERLSTSVYSRPSQKPEILSPDKIRMAHSTYTYFMDDVRLAVTQSLGHNGITGICPYKKTVEFGDMDNVVVLVASDGFWDMVILEHDLPICLKSNATQLAEFAEARWKQTWNVEVKPDKFAPTRFDRFDDIGVAVWSQLH